MNAYNWKIIFMFIKSNERPFPEMTGNFKHFVHEIWPWTCGWIVFKFYKMQTMSENCHICRDITISCGDYGKKLGRFCKIWHVCWLQIEVSPKKIHRIENDSLRFRVKVMIKLGFDFKTFCIGNRHHKLVHIKFWLFFGFVW